MDKQESIGLDRDCVARCGAVKDGSSWPRSRWKEPLKLISPPLRPSPPQLGAFASPRSPRTSRWCWGNGWCCPAWSSTTAASSSGPRTAWPSASARVCEVSGGTEKSRGLGERKEKKKKGKLSRAAELRGSKWREEGESLSYGLCSVFDCNNPDGGYYGWNVQGVLQH